MLTKRQREWAETIAAKPASRRSREEQRVLEAFRALDRGGRAAAAVRSTAGATAPSARPGAVYAPTLWSGGG
jgi:hypothetical protein